MNSGVVRLDQIMYILLTMNHNPSQSLLLGFVLNMPHIIKLKLHNNWSPQAVDNILESAMWKPSKPIKLLISKKQPVNELE